MGKQMRAYTKRQQKKFDADIDAIIDLAHCIQPGCHDECCREQRLRLEALIDAVPREPTYGQMLGTED